jgi:hypothetical protein
MGGSVSIHIQNLSTRKFNLGSEVFPHLPSYYLPVISKSDILKCQQHWDHITNQLDPPIAEAGALSRRSELIGELYDSNKTWFYALLSDGIASTILAEFSFRTHPFLSKMFEIIQISFSQWHHLTEFQHQTVLLTKECCNYGIKTQNFIDFGPILFHSLLLVSRSFTPDLDRAWKRLYSSILAVILPYCLEFGDIATIPDEGLPLPPVHHPLPPSPRSPSAEAKPIQSEPTALRQQTPMPPPTVTLSGASSRPRMETSISNTVPL